jgi:hypothetical protein
MPRSIAVRNPSRTGLKNSTGLIVDALASGLKPLRNIQKTGKKKVRTSTQVRVVTAALRSLRFIGRLLP